MELGTGTFLGANQALSRRVGADEVAADRQAGLYVTPVDICAAETRSVPSEQAVTPRCADDR